MSDLLELVSGWWADPQIRVPAVLFTGWLLFRWVKRRFRFGRRAQMDWGRSQRMFSEAQRVAVQRRDGRRCAYCGTRRGLQVDHVIAWSHGGPTDLWNAQMLCGADSGSGVNCNVSIKSDRREDHARARYLAVTGKTPRTGMRPPRRACRRWSRYYKTAPGAGADVAARLMSSRR